MNNLNGKSNPELVELKKVPYEGDKNRLINKFIPNKYCFFLGIGLFVIIGISILIYQKITNDLNAELLEKDLEIEKLEKQLNDLKNQQKLLAKKRQTDESKNSKLTRLDKEYEYDKNFYIANQMHAAEDLNRLGYELLFHTHTLEKALSHFELRPFGQKKVEIIMDILVREKKYKGYEDDFSFINGINSLREYKKTYEEHKWTDRPEYKKVSDFLKDYEKVPFQETGARIVTKEKLKKDYDVDYGKFIKSRHSTRNYINETLKIEDIEKAVDMARYTPSACNRQFVKVHYYPSGKMRQNVIDYSIGKGGIYLDGVNTFIITFDVNALSGAGERNQGYFNAGLFGTNLVNAFHSLGIGTCFIQFANPVEEEEKLKELNDIPSHERIAVILYAGYYDEKSIFAVSPRKSFEDYFTDHK